MKNTVATAAVAKLMTSEAEVDRQSTCQGIGAERPLIALAIAAPRV